MSVRTSAAVWERSQHSGTHLLMLLAIGDFADDEGRAYPSVPTLARKCRMKERNARYILAELVDSGELSIQRGKGPRGSNVYRIKLDLLGVQQSAGVQSFAGVQQSAPNPCNTLPLTPATHCSQTIIEPSMNRKRALKRSDITFDGWIKSCEEQGIDPIPAEHPVLAWADKAGIGEWVDLAWDWFKNNYQGSDKRYKDWPQVFGRAVRGNWGKQWRKGRDGNFELTVEGETTRRALEQS